MNSEIKVREKRGRGRMRERERERERERVNINFLREKNILKNNYISPVIETISINIYFLKERKYL